MDKNEVLKILEMAKDKNGEVPMRLVRQAFEKLPESCEDAISRQAAIDAFDTQCWGRINIPICKEIRNAAKDTIKTLPAVQPEIIRCKDCEYRGDTPISDGRYWCKRHDTFMYYCSDAERRREGEADGQR